MSASVRFAMVVLVCLVGCASRAPSVPPTSSNCPNGYYMCEWPATSTVHYAALFHFKKSYPAQTAELEDFPLPKGWIMEEKGDLVVIWNTVTGFRWEGTIGWREISLGECCVGTMPEAYIIKESVTTVVPTIAPNVVLDPTRGPDEQTAATIGTAKPNIRRVEVRAAIGCARTTKLYDRTKDAVTVDEIERIRM